MRIAVEPKHVHRLLNHGPTTMITTAHGGRRNVMAAAWVMPLDFTPPKFAAVVASDTLTRELLVASGECVLHAPTTLQTDLCYAVGSHSGRDGCKFERFQIATSSATTVAAPLIDGCAAFLECRVVNEPEMAERYDLFVLECTAAFADDSLWRDGSWQFANGGPRTIHHEKGGRFFATGERVEAKR